MSTVHFEAPDVYRHRESLIHRLDPRVKLVVTLLFVIVVALVPEEEWLVYGLLAILALFVVALSRVGVRAVQRRAAPALTFALAAVTLVFSTPGRSILTVWVLGRRLSATTNGLARFASVVLKSWLSIQMAVVLTASTTFPDLLQAMRGIGLPKIMVMTVGLTYRYIFVIGDEALRMLRARAARSGSPGGKGGGSVLWRARVTGAMAGSLFLRSIERSERIYGAMVARGYNGEVRSLKPSRLRVRDLLITTPFVLSLVIISLMARLSG